MTASVRPSTDQAASLRQMVLGREAPSAPVPGGGPSIRFARVVAVSSGKGGVGKTSLAVNLALALRELGLQVAVVDADLGMANVDILLGLVPRWHLGHVAEGSCTLEEAVCLGPDEILVVPGASGLLELASMRGEPLQRLLRELRRLDQMVDVVLIDTGAGIGEQVMAFLESAPEVLVVCTPEPTAITDAYGLVKALLRARGGSPRPGHPGRFSLVVNMSRSTDEGRRVARRLQTVAQRFLGIELVDLGVVPYDPAASAAVIDQVPLLKGWPASPAARGIRQVARRLLDLPAAPSGGGLSGALRRMLRLTRGEGGVSW